MADALNILNALLSRVKRAVVVGAAPTAQMPCSSFASANAAANSFSLALLGDDPNRVDVAWTPYLPTGHTAYSWGLVDEEGEASVPASAATADPVSAPATKTVAPQAKNEQKQQQPSQGKPKEPKDNAKGKEKDSKNQKSAKGQAQESTKNKGKTDAKPSAPAAAPADPSRPPFTRMNFVVGRIVSAEKHPNADKMFVEMIDVGEPEPRQICSGLVGLVPVEELRGSLCVVVANLKPANLRGKMSAGMILAASLPADSAASGEGRKCALVLPPEGSRVGERVFCVASSEEERKLPPDENGSVDFKVEGNPWTAVAPDLRTDGTGQVTYKGAALSTSVGIVRAALANCVVK